MWSREPAYSGIGSVPEYHYHVAGNANLPPEEESHRAEAAMDVVLVRSYIMNGTINVRFTFSNEKSMVGGHSESVNKDFTFFSMTAGILPDDPDMKCPDNYRLLESLE